MIKMDANDGVYTMDMWMCPQGRSPLCVVVVVVCGGGVWWLVVVVGGCGADAS